MMAGPRYDDQMTIEGKFSVIIPTLQRSDELRPLVEQCSAHPLVHEVLVINNATAPLSWDSPKVRVLQQAQNIYVNPAWNLGARNARAQLLAIVNDDVRFGDEVFTYAAALLSEKRVGMVGPAPQAFTPHPGRKVGHREATDFSLRRGFGTCMMMRREDYVQIPDSIKVWGGDNWLFVNQRNPSQELLGFRFLTEMSTTSSSEEFQEFRRQEADESFRLLACLIGSQDWHDRSGRIDKRRVRQNRWRNRLLSLVQSRRWVRPLQS